MILEPFRNLFIGRPKSDRRLKRFEVLVDERTKKNHDKIVKWAENVLVKPIDEENYLQSNSIIVRRGYELRKKTLNKFKNKYENSGLRILIHYPGDDVSVAGRSLFTNLAKGLTYIGVTTKLMLWNSDTKKCLDDFKPNVFLTSDDQCYLDRIDWDELKDFRYLNDLKIGLTASAGEHSNRSIETRLAFGRDQEIDFYYCYWDRDYVKNTKGYNSYFNEGYKIFSVELGANILNYYPIPNIKKDLDYIFLGSTNRKKRPEYHNYFTQIFKNYYGFYGGPGWKISKENVNFKRDKFLYSRSKVGLNLHVDNQLKTSNELNERAYMLAACGIPQLIDNPKILGEKFSKDSMFIAKNPKEYYQLFNEIINNSKLAQERALKALEEVYSRHTSFHRSERFLNDLLSL